MVTPGSAPEPLLLIVGGDSDPNTQRVVDQAHLRDLPYRFWDTDSPTALRIAWDFDTPAIDLDGETLRPSAVFLRYNVFAGEPARNLAAFDTVQAYCLAWPQLRMLNRLAAADANNKCRNLRWARDAGLAIPQTLVMADLSPLATMPAPAEHVIKPLVGGAHTQAVADICGDHQRLAGLPPQFVQNRLQGENLRLFWIGDHPFCFHLQSEALDYREDACVQVERIEPPPQLLAPALRLVQRIGFDYCALDFRCTRGWEQPIFLEVNSFPMFVRFDDASDNRLVDAILDLLIGNRETAPAS